MVRLLQGQIHTRSIPTLLRPARSKSYDSSSPLIRFVGSRFNSFDNMYVTMIPRWTDEKGAATPPDDVCGHWYRVVWWSVQESRNRCGIHRREKSLEDRYLQQHHDVAQTATDLLSY
ncbi:hypothetical protein C8R48DRAFT_311450 [Suillus tomentosus]|nr:hypothetical protein C8R48DRAFT_311450 [Suillus tomentosus]